MGSSCKDNQYIVLPYIKNLTTKISSRLNNSDTKLGLRCLNRLNNFIKVWKDKNKKGERNNVIYKINCIDCDVSYVGQTKRQLGTRLTEHRYNVRLDPSKHSVVSEHIIQFNHSFDWENVRVLDTEFSFQKRLTSEMIHIKEQKNGINLHKDSELLNVAYFEIISGLTK